MTTETTSARETGRSAPITKDSIFAAADELVTQGRPVNTNALRDHLGGGSYTTLTKHFKEWRAARAHRENLSPPAEIPETVTRVLNTAVAEIWRSVTADATRKITEVKEAADRRIQDVETEQAQTFGEVARLEKENGTLSAELGRLMERTQEQDQTIAAARAIEEELRSRLGHEGNRARELEMRVGELQEGLKETKEQLAAAEAQGQGLMREKNALERELEETKRQLKDAESARSDTKIAADAIKRENGAYKVQIMELEKNLQTTKALEAEIRQTLDVERKARAEATNRHDDLAKQLVTLAAERPQKGAEKKSIT